MVNFHDPAVVIEDAWAAVKLCHAVDGLYLWEFVTNLDYEWSIIRGHRPYGWTIWIYSLTRWAAFVGVVLNIVGLDITMSINCQVWMTSQLIFGYLSFGAASLLIVLRMNRVVTVTAACIWVTNIAFLIQGESFPFTFCKPGVSYKPYLVSGTARLRGKWSPSFGVCVVANIGISKLNTIVTLASDIVLLLMMLFGLLRLRRYGSGMFLAKLMWRQVQFLLAVGLIWLLAATITEVTPAYNWQNFTFSTPLCNADIPDFVSESTEMFDIHPSPLVFALIMVAMNATYQPYLSSQTTLPTHGSSTDGQLHIKPRGLSLDDDVERGRVN
ncbi:hypothetical protein BJV74DRAFT_799493 [Russula compacta]|nr:hypothetical protein BJV74DRAFT_799493 [Russula compacta]